MDCNATNCLNEQRFKNLEDDMRELKEKYSREHKEFFERIEGLEKENAVLKNDIEHIRKTVDEMNENLKILMQTPAKRYDTFVVTAITSLITAILAFILRGILPT